MTVPNPAAKVGVYHNTGVPRACQFGTLRSSCRSSTLHGSAAVTPRQLARATDSVMEAFRIAAVGLSAWESNFLQATVAIASSTDIGRWSYEPDPAVADAVLASTGSPEGVAWLEGGRVSSAALRPIVVALWDRASGEPSPPGPALGRPVVYAELIATLRRLEIELRDRGMARTPLDVPVASPSAPPPEPAPTAVSTETGSGPAVPVAELPAAALLDPMPVMELPTPDPAPDEGVAAASEMTMPESHDLALARKGRRAARFFDDTRLLGVIRRVIQSGQAGVITHPRIAAVTIYPVERRYASSVDPCDSLEVFRVPAREFSYRALALGSAEDLLSRTATRPLTRLLYWAALEGSEGRLRAEAELDDTLEFVATPELSSASVAAEHEAIVKALVLGPCALAQLAVRSGRSLDATVNVINALEVVGCLRRTRGDATPDTQDHHPPPAAGSWGWTSRALRRLRAVLRTAGQGQG
jgi:hypothetical protein